MRRRISSRRSRAIPRSSRSAPPPPASCSPVSWRSRWNVAAVREASKTLALLTAAERGALTGKGLDIGCGDDPIRPDVQCFDVADGDANRITDFIRAPESFDYVFSSHCLEHMRDPTRAMTEWWSLVKPNGTMFVIVPDEDLYE